MRVNAGNLKKGDFISHNNEVWQVVKTEFNFQGRGMAVMRTKIKNTVSGKNIDVTYKTVADVERVDVVNQEMQYLYNDGTNLHFMDERSYNQLEVPLATVGDVHKFFKEGNKYFVMMYNDRPLTVRPPASVKLKVVEAENAVKGNTVSGAKKSAKVETGVTVMVPLFVKVGETIAINPETGEYVERVKG